ncbi:MAG: hypothetical protein V2I26_06545 [Halieaceae bacterium]|jgi:hypothetical protein|nr:hypothetical protein [Halieaceae bacterium]
MSETILLIGIAGCLAWLLLRLFPRQSNTRAATSRDTSSRAHPYHAVSIHTGSTACLPAKALKHKRFLSGEAPQLPLAECTGKKCHCVYQHHPDRRSGSGDRRAIGSTAREILGGQSQGERRRARGRRAIDMNGDDLSWV